MADYCKRMFCLLQCFREVKLAGCNYLHCQRVTCSVLLTHSWHSASSVCCSWLNVPSAPVPQEHPLFPRPDLVSSILLTHDFLFQLCIVLQLSSSFLWSSCPCLPSFLPQWFLTERSLSSRTSVCYKILLFVASFLLISINFLYYLPLTIREQMLQLLLKNNGIKRLLNKYSCFNGFGFPYKEGILISLITFQNTNLKQKNSHKF